MRLSTFTLSAATPSSSWKFYFPSQQIQSMHCLLHLPPLCQQCPDGRQAVTHIPAVTVSRAAGATADGP